MTIHIDIVINNQETKELSAEKQHALCVLLGLTEPEPTVTPAAAMPQMEPAPAPTPAAAMPQTEPAPTPVPAAAPMPPVEPAPVPTPTADVKPAQVPTSAPTYTLDQIQAAIGPLLQAGRHTDLQNLLAKYQVATMTDLQPVQYGAFAADLRAMGAQI